jgi:hypothetical protein
MQLRALVQLKADYGHNALSESWARGLFYEFINKDSKLDERNGSLLLNLMPSASELAALMQFLQNWDPVKGASRGVVWKAALALIAETPMEQHFRALNAGPEKTVVIVGMNALDVVSKWYSVISWGWQKPLDFLPELYLGAVVEPPNEPNLMTLSSIASAYPELRMEEHSFHFREESFWNFDHHRHVHFYGVAQNGLRGCAFAFAARTVERMNAPGFYHVSPNLFSAGASVALEDWKRWIAENYNLTNPYHIRCVVIIFVPEEAVVREFLRELVAWRNIFIVTYGPMRFAIESATQVMIGPLEKSESMEWCRWVWKHLAAGNGDLAMEHLLLIIHVFGSVPELIARFLAQYEFLLRTQQVTTLIQLAEAEYRAPFVAEVLEALPLELREMFQFLASCPVPLDHDVLLKGKRGLLLQELSNRGVLVGGADGWHLLEVFLGQEVDATNSIYQDFVKVLFHRLEEMDLKSNITAQTYKMEWVRRHQQFLPWLAHEVLAKGESAEVRTLLYKLTHYAEISGEHKFLYRLMDDFATAGEPSVQALVHIKRVVLHYRIFKDQYLSLEDSNIIDESIHVLEQYGELAEVAHTRVYMAEFALRSKDSPCRSKIQLWLNSSLEFYKKRNMHSSVGWVQTNLSEWIAQHEGWDAIDVHLYEALDSYKQAEHTPGMGWSCFLLGRAAYFRFEYARAIECFQRAMRYYHDMNDQVMELAVSAWMHRVGMDSGVIPMESKLGGELARLQFLASWSDSTLLENRWKPPVLEEPELLDVSELLEAMPLHGFFANWYHWLVNACVLIVFEQQAHFLREPIERKLRNLPEGLAANCLAYALAMCECVQGDCARAQKRVEQCLSFWKEAGVEYYKGFGLMYGILSRNVSDFALDLVPHYLNGKDWRLQVLCSLVCYQMFCKVASTDQKWPLYIFVMDQLQEYPYLQTYAQKFTPAKNKEEEAVFFKSIRSRSWTERLVLEL